MPDNVDLGPTLESVVSDLVAKGRYNSKADVLRDGVRLIQERESRIAALDAALAVGVADADEGRVTPAEEVFRDLRRRYRGPSRSA